MKIVIKHIFFFALLFVSSANFGQAFIFDVSFRQENDVVVINYNLHFYGELNKIENVKVYMSIDGGAYRKLSYVSGDVGTVKTSGKKEIIFYVFKEFGKMEIDGYVNFKIEGDYNYVPSKPPKVKKPYELGVCSIEYLITPTLIQSHGVSFGLCWNWGFYANFIWEGDVFSEYWINRTTLTPQNRTKNLKN